ncbi:potassium channel family protein [Tautonia plasticadhaerens]|uniref:Potassium channel domain-containing protein n=1 Tax=Tautonia plasticadhaerens TaxID=2527974 RepID=A0A518GYZ5_9BACT|nr:potassium channel family protein [Tautonia plasticadhaerens]QDV33836.1 hypothetical protein ElP_17160 [Tautonia plasticadhaerens]
MTQLLLYAIATTLLLFVAFDAFVTVFSTRGAGPMTGLWTRSAWKALLAIHRRRPVHRVLAMSGPMMLLLAILAWYALLGLGWFLLFAGDATSVIDKGTGTAVGLPEKVYFVGATISGVGYGDLVPRGLPWTVLSNVAVLSGTVLLTTSLSYVLSVISAAIERKRLAEGIFAVGGDVEEFVANAWARDPGGPLDDHIMRLASRIGDHSLKHLCYPVLHYYHSDDPRQSPSRAILLLSDALFLIDHYASPEARPPEGVLKVAWSSIENYSSRADNGVVGIEQVDRDVPNHLDRETLVQLGIPTRTSGTDAGPSGYLERRRRLVAMCRQDGWSAS